MSCHAQVLLSYGTYTNLELLEHYGFLLNNNPNDKVYIPLEPGVSSCSSWPAESLYINQGGEPSYALFPRCDYGLHLQTSGDLWDIWLTQGLNSLQKMRCVLCT